MSDKKATLKIDGIDDAIELPVYSGSLGPDVVDVGGLTGKGLFTYDPGFCLHRRLRVADYLYQRFRGHSAAPGLSHRSAG